VITNTLVILTQKDPIFNLKIINSLIELDYKNTIIIFGNKKKSFTDLLVNILMFGLFTCVKFFLLNFSLEKKILNKNKKIKFFYVKDGDESLLNILNNNKEKYHGVSLSFPFKISQRCINLFKDRIINFHNSELPFYRGLSPIFYQLLENKKNFSFSIHFINDRIDDGDIINQTTLINQKKEKYKTCTKILEILCEIQALVVLCERENLFNFKHKYKRSESGKYYSKPKLTEAFKMRMKI
tara:strand:- start:155 stop:874 length:720 start_codon:yes stop_codon:yes gene_type:complete